MKYVCDYPCPNINQLRNAMSSGTLRCIVDHKQNGTRCMVFREVHLNIYKRKGGLCNNSHTHTWWRHQMETFSALLAICAGNSPVPGEFPTQRPVTRSFDVFFDLRLNKRLSKQWWGWWFEKLSRPLWRHRNYCGCIIVVNNQSLVIIVVNSSQGPPLLIWMSNHMPNKLL